MINKDKAMKVWDSEFGKSTQKALDACGVMMAKAAYGQEGEFGWEVDHINPVANNGTDALSNLQPLHWKTNKCKADKTGMQRGQCPRGC